LYIRINIKYEHTHTHILARISYIRHIGTERMAAVGPPGTQRVKVRVRSDCYLLDVYVAGYYYTPMWLWYNVCLFLNSIPIYFIIVVRCADGERGKEKRL